MKKRLSCLFAALALLVGAVSAQTPVSINWSVDKGVTGSMMNGVNLWRGLSTAYSSSTYRERIWYLNPGLMRVHNSGQTGLWLIPDGAGGYEWDAERINATMDGLKSGAPPATWIMTIHSWPADWADANGRLLPSRYADYAVLCAELVDLLKSRNITYWECFNEKEGRYSVAEMGQLAEIFAACVDAMKDADPRVLVGPAWYLPYDTARLNAFLDDPLVQSRMGVWTYHHYATGDANITTEEIVTRAVDIADRAAHMRNLLNTKGYAGLKSFITETNIFWAWDLDTDLRMRGPIGAVLQALCYKRLIERGATDGVASWNDADNIYGKMSTSYSLYPPGYLMRTINAFLRGTWVSTSSTNNGQISVFAVKNGTSRSFMLVNPSATTQTATINFNGWSYPSGEWKRRKIDSHGLTESTHTWSSLDPSSLTLGAYSVHICTFP